MEKGLAAADRVIVIASPEYRRAAADEAPPTERRGVRWEIGFLRDVVYADRDAALR
jgi:hypothetical protein